jgi:DNA-binding IclR family transcriptional regulator
MLDLVRTTGATVQLGVLSAGDILILEKLPGNHRIPVPTSIGSRLPAVRSALGRAILAYTPSPGAVCGEESHAPVRGLHPADRDGAVLERALCRVRESGLAIENVRPLSGVLSLAAPIVDPGSDSVSAALSVTCHATAEAARRVETQLRETAAAISRDLSAPMSA